MTTSVQKIFSGTLFNGELTRTDNFYSVNAIFIIPQNLPPDELYEIACGLVVNLTVVEIVGGIPIIKNYGTKEIKLEVDYLDTSTMLLIPEEITKQELSAYLIFAVSYNINVDIYAIRYEQPSNERVISDLKAHINAVCLAPQPTQASLQSANISLGGSIPFTQSTPTTLTTSSNSTLYNLVF